MVVFADENIVLIEELLSPYCQLRKYSGRALKNEDLRNSGCEILFTRSQTKINRELLENTNVKLIATATSGTDHVDIDYINSCGIPFYSAKGSNSNSVAEYVIYSILKWGKANNIDLNETTIGIVGFGSIGKKVALYSAAMGLNVLINDPPLVYESYSFPDYVEYSELDELISKSHILTNHVPLNIGGKYNSFKLFNENNLKSFGANGLIIHSSRGGVMDEAILHKLKAEKNISLVIDVWENEPDFDTNLAEKCIIATPHIAGYSHNGKLNGTEMMIEIFENFTSINVSKELLINEFNKSSQYKIQDFISMNDVYNQLQKRRKLDDDSDNLKSLTNLEKPLKTQEFDKLRKLYPVRYELLRAISH